MLCLHVIVPFVWSNHEYTLFILKKSSTHASRLFCALSFESCVTHFFSATLTHHFLLSVDCTYLRVPAAMVCIIFLIFEGILFGLFTLAMFCTQVCSICRDETVNMNLWFKLYCISFANDSVGSGFHDVKL